ncbi:MAG: ABC transporter ATP-binding protein [Planctomycetes bacterium]|nr:ABC transporter ATP-binding protein [Planctomycetota bacterium]
MGDASATAVATEPAIICRGVTKVFESDDSVVHALRGIDFEARPGEMLLLVGPSGCGKTTLLSVVAGILDQTAGEIRVYGQDVHSMKPAQKTAFRLRNIGFVFQQFNLVPSLTAAENVAVPLLLRGVKRAAAVQRGRELLTQVGLADKTEVSPLHLSGGQQQRVAIARAMAPEPRLIVCDEPTASLDGETGQHVMELLKSTAVAADRCVVVVTHDSRVFRFGDRIAEMLDGRITSIRNGAEHG